MNARTIALALLATPAAASTVVWNPLEETWDRNLPAILAFATKGCTQIPANAYARWTPIKRPYLRDYPCGVADQPTLVAAPVYAAIVDGTHAIASLPTTSPAREGTSPFVQPTPSPTVGPAPTTTAPTPQPTVVAPIPLPATVWLMIAALVGLNLWRKTMIALSNIAQTGKQSEVL